MARRYRPIRPIGTKVTLIDAYEAKHHPIPAPGPIAAIEFTMQQNGLARRDLEPAIGSRGRSPRCSHASAR